MKNFKSVFGATALAVGALSAAPANASLIFLGEGTIGGTGLGTVSTVLTVQSPGSSSTETGSVSFNGTTDVISGDALTGASQTLTRTIGEIGSPTASDFRLVFNAIEPGGNSITLTALTLSLYGTNGSLLYSTSLFPLPQTYPDTNTGAGNSGLLFGFDATSLADASLLAAFNNDANRIGLSATATSATGGPDTFFVGATSATPVPEPMSLALFGAGLLGLGAVRRKRSA